MKLLAAALAAVVVAAAPGGAAASRVSVASPPRPHIVWKPIPFPASRKAEMAAYSLAHYGTSTWRLTSPHVIVEHYTANESFSGTWNGFAADAADPELGEKPGDCAHFVIDRDGTIYQLVPLTIRCRHTVGLNWTAIGIEDVGESDGEILANVRQRDAAVALTVWLMARYHISLGDVIGHDESLDSPYHHELDAAWRCQTHGDWVRADMDRFRALLVARARRYRVPLGKRVDRLSSPC
ncbi:MAG TPA: peptidoglycan recognition family protein [Gaiellaceae bacterium]|nr:peptidoglycan recognition family protein [Gaiellaceae bacterium]